MKPLEHAKNNVEKYGGVIADYIKIHEVLDSSKSGLGDKRHRACYHNSHFIYHILPMIFGSFIKNSEGKTVSTSQIGEDHICEDMGEHGLQFIPTISDWLASLPMEAWMDGGREYPPSRRNLEKQAEVEYVVREIPPDGPSKIDYEKIIKQLEEIDWNKKEVNEKIVTPKVDWANIRLDGATKAYREFLVDLPAFFTTPHSD